MVLDDPLLILHKYYMAASYMKKQFDEELDSNQGKSAFTASPDLISTMCLWYGSLYVVIEGWDELGFQDATIAPLLKNPLRDLLRGCRNDTFHFQAKYYPNRYIKLISDKEAAKWIRELHDRLGNFFLEQFELRKNKSTF